MAIGQALSADGKSVVSLRATADGEQLVAQKSGDELDYLRLIYIELVNLRRELALHNDLMFPDRDLTNERDVYSGE